VVYGSDSSPEVAAEGCGRCVGVNCWGLAMVQFTEVWSRMVSERVSRELLVSKVREDAAERVPRFPEGFREAVHQASGDPHPLSRPFL